MKTLLLWIFLASIFLLAAGCGDMPVDGSWDKPAASNEVEKIEVPKKPATQPAARIALYWENTTAPHPERKPWSDAVIGLFKKDLDTFKKASDISTFCPKFQSLGESDQLKALGEFWVAVSYFESGFNPASASVDVGTKENKDTWSVGLYQMSVVDQKNYKLPFGYKYDDLLKPIPNITLALAVLKAQVEKRGVLAIPAPNPGLYWAVLRPGGKYDHSAEIAGRVKKYAPKCN